ncbi:MAG: Rrf2 family transcriptional regulator [Candidatus Fonsibacter sp.]|nr:Rrf2 family transcriptional regulator [Candidatus Fonsibacter sp.]
MKLTAKGRYAVMAMADLAAFNKQQKPVSLNDISIRQRISLSFLEQLFFKLKKKDLVTSVRGNLGGYKLSRDPNKIHLSSVIEAVNEDIKTTKCKLKSKKGCTGKATKCVTHNLWDGLTRHINNYFTSVTLLDVLENKIPRNIPFENSTNQSQGANK